MPSSRSAEWPVFRCRMVAALLLMPALACAQPSQKTPPKKVSAHRANEFTLAGLHPGRDSLARAAGLYKKADDDGTSGDSQVSWTDQCRRQRLILDYDTGKKVQVIRVVYLPFRSTDGSGMISVGDCGPVPPSPWKTGLGLRLWDGVDRVAQLYGPPDSKSPSTRDGQPLELWYYAFDWAGPDVPQVMEVLCTRGQNGQAGRVVEITLAAPSL